MGWDECILSLSNYRLNESLALVQVGREASGEGAGNPGFINHLLLCPIPPCTQRWTHTREPCQEVVQGWKKTLRVKMTSTWWLLLEPGYVPSDLACQDNAQRAAFILKGVYRKYNPGPPSSYPRVGGLASEGNLEGTDSRTIARGKCICFA